MKPFVTGVGTYLPSQKHDAEFISSQSGIPASVIREKFGINSKPVAGPGDDPMPMAVRAAKSALKAASMNASDIDVVIAITDDYKDHPLQASGVTIAHEVGAHRAWGFDVGQKCGSALLGLKLARSLLDSDSSINSILLAGGYRNRDLVDYSDPDSRSLFNLADGGGAAVVTRANTGLEILGSGFRSDGSLSEYVRVDVGGTRVPMTADNFADYRLRVHNPEALKKRLDEVSIANFKAVSQEALQHSGLQLSDVTWCGLLHMKPTANQQVLDALGFTTEQSVYLSDYGHVGQIDPLLLLQLARERKIFKEGDVALLIAAGIGYVWNAICLRWVE